MRLFAFALTVVVAACNAAPTSPIDGAPPMFDPVDDFRSDTSPGGDQPGTPGACVQARGTGTSPTDRYTDGMATTSVVLSEASSCLRTYTLSSTAPLRDNQPANPRRVVERLGFSTTRTRNDLFDALYALALDEARENSVQAIRDGAFNDGAPIACPSGGCFETGRLWTYVWTRDTAYSVDLALGAFDPLRARNSLEFKLSERRGGGDLQVVQDTGTGGSYPVSTDRVGWALGAMELAKYLGDNDRVAFEARALEALRNTCDHDRAVIYDPRDGLYRGEHSFLDWREQSYAPWTATDTVHIAMSKSLSTNVLHYAALDAVATLATARGDSTTATRYRMWADALRSAIRTRFWDDDARQLRAFVPTELDPAPARRWDLLGSALAILHGVIDDTRAQAAIESYPHVGRGGAPVLWPQQQFTAIYHNRAMWPFVTAYWLRAARRVRNDAVVNRGVTALMRAAALNLSNMENLEVVTGSPRVDEGPTSGPVVNSQRQLWSVAAYLSMVHDVLFGIEATREGMRVRPYVTRTLRNTLFVNADTLVLNDFLYRGRRITVVINLPPRSETREGAYRVGAVRLDGRDVGDALVIPAMLQTSSTFEVTLVDSPERGAAIREVSNPSDYKNLFAPRTPSITRIDVDQGTGRLRLTIDASGEMSGDIRFRIYRMGRLVANELQGSTTVWTDPEARDGNTPEACYTVESYYVTSGNTSQRAQPVCWWGRDAHRMRSFTAHDLRATGGTASNNHGRFHYENWGDVGHALELPFFRPDATGEHLLQVIASNGSGGFTTGITCAVKRVRVQELPSNADVATGYFVMPQTGTWETWRGSSFVRARLDASRTYRVIIDSDARAVNMSSFAHFERYNGGTGGRSGAFARVNIAELRVLPLHAGTGTGATVALNGSDDLERFNPEARVTPGVVGASTDAFALTWDDGFLYAAVRARALADNDLRPFVMYFDTREGDERFGPVATRVGLTYFDQTPTLPFEATWALLLRRRSDAGDGAGPFNGLFRWEGTRWVRTTRFVEGRDFWSGTDPDRTLSLRITRASLGAPRRMRLASHAVLGGGLYQCTVPDEHQPWTAGRTTGFFEVDLLSPPSATRLWPRR